MFCVSTMIIKILNALLSFQMLSSFPAKQGGCYTVGHFEYRKICLISCAPCLFYKTHFQPAAQGQNTRTPPSTGHHQEYNFICLQMHLSEKCFDYYSSQSQINYIQLHKHLEELLWFSRLLKIFFSLR